MSTWQKISKLSRKEIEHLQNQKLRKFFKLNFNFHPYYKKLFADNNIDPNSIKTTEDLKKLPFTTKLDLLPTKENPKKFMDFVLQPTEELIKRYYPRYKLFYWTLESKQNFKSFLEHEYKPVHMHFTTGRSAMSIPFLYTQKDVETLQEVGLRLMDVFNVKKDSIAVNAFPYSPHLAFWLAYNALYKAKISALHTGGGKIMGTEKIINAVEKMKANLVMAIPGYFYHLLREADSEKKDFSSLTHVIFGGEGVSLDMKNKLKDLLLEINSQNAKLLTTYAFTEGKGAWGECLLENGESTGYHLYPDLEFIELIDPKTGERVGEKESGEIVYTSFGWNGSVVLRYRTGDLCKGIYYDPCPVCGKTVPRLDSHIERSSEYKDIMLTKVKGNLINLNQFAKILHSVKEIYEWQVEIKKKNNDPFELDELIVYVALSKKLEKKTDKNELKALLYKKIIAEMEFTPEIVFKDLKELEHMLGLGSELKEKRIVDRRQNK